MNQSRSMNRYLIQHIIEVVGGVQIIFQFVSKTIFFIWSKKFKLLWDKQEKEQLRHVPVLACQHPCHLFRGKLLFIKWKKLWCKRKKTHDVATFFLVSFIIISKLKLLWNKQSKEELHPIPVLACSNLYCVTHYQTFLFGVRLFLYWSQPNLEQIHLFLKKRQSKEECLVVSHPVHVFSTAKNWTVQITPPGMGPVNTTRTSV